eukprot:1536559-Amphidinium_carterae.1
MRALRKASLPWFYIYDAYNVPASHWSWVLKTEGKATLRGTRLDGVFLALPGGQVGDLLEAGFDGIYTYFGWA